MEMTRRMASEDSMMKPLADDPPEKRKILYVFLECPSCGKTDIDPFVLRCPRCGASLKGVKPKMIEKEEVSE